MSSIFLDEKGSYFVGKTKNLKKIESILASCEVGTGIGINVGSIDVAKFLKVKPQIEKLFKEEFNCKEFYLSCDLADVSMFYDKFVKWEENSPHLDFSEDSFRNFALAVINANAYTISDKEIWESIRNKRLEISPGIIERSSFGGYRFKKGHEQFVFIKISPAFISRLSAKKLIAAILHETGHNFYSFGVVGGIYNLVIGTIFGFYSVISKYLQTYLSKFIKWAVPDFIKTVFNNISSILDRILNIYNKFEGFFKFTEIINGRAVLAKPIFSYESIRTIANNIISGSYSNEKFADEFVTSYGYGSELIGGLLASSDTVSNNKNSADLLEAALYLPIATIQDCLYGLEDSHGNIFTRYNYCKKFLEEQISKEKDPRVKKQIVESLKRFEVISDKRKFSIFLHAIGFPVDVIKEYAEKILFHNSYTDVMKNSGIVNNSFNPFFLR